jgi:hypothetical protein
MIYRCILFVICFMLIERFCHKQTEGFRPYKIRSDLSFNPEWEVPPLDREAFGEVKTALDQPFSFLKSGGQCYTFLSADGKYVLKVFKHHHMRLNSPLNRFSFPAPFDKYRLKLLGARDSPEKRLREFFSSCHLAYRQLREETALLCVHLNKTKSFNQKLTLIDKLGIAHAFDCDTLEFVLQHKAELVYSKLKTLIRNNEIESAKEHLDSLLRLIRHRSELAICNKDAVIKKNFGFLGKRAIEIDVGSYQTDLQVQRGAIYNERLLKETDSLKRWLKKHHDELYTYFTQAIRKALASSERLSSAEEVL